MVNGIYLSYIYWRHSLVLPLETKITAAFSQHNTNPLLKQNHLIKILLIVIPYSRQEDGYKYTIKRSSFCLLKFYIKEILPQLPNQYVTLVQNRPEKQEPSQIFIIYTYESLHFINSPQKLLSFPSLKKKILSGSVQEP